MSRTRAYLDWNASAPLRPEARAAMLSAMDEVGNPSSVHAEGRKAKATVERARAQVADLVGCEPGEVVFTSGATEAANIVFSRKWNRCLAGATEHDCIEANLRRFSAREFDRLKVESCGRVGLATSLEGQAALTAEEDALVVLQAANSETGVEQTSVETSVFASQVGWTSLIDYTQLLGRRRLFDGPHMSFGGYRLASAHKLGGPVGVGSLVIDDEAPSVSTLSGGGQEQGRRAGTENVIGIAGFGAAAEAAKRDLEAGVWEGVEAVRDRLEDRLASAAPDLIVFGKEASRLPNTSCFAIPGWKGETQVMQMDLAGFAVSAGSACSSGKVEKASRVLLAMGFDEVTASSAIRVSIGPTTTEAEVMGFADAWEAAYRRWRNKAA